MRNGKPCNPQPIFPRSLNPLTSRMASLQSSLDDMGHEKQQLEVTFLGVKKEAKRGRFDGVKWVGKRNDGHGIGLEGERSPDEVYAKVLAPNLRPVQR